MLSRLIELTHAKVKKTGAQYRTFACFGLINYPLAYLYELYVKDISGGLWIRALSAFLCLILLLKDKWPCHLKKYLPIYWYMTLTISIPVLTTYLLLYDNFSLGWLLNANTGTMILILLVDSYSFLMIEATGIALGILLFYLTGHSIHSWPNHDHMMLSLYMFFSIGIIGSIFTRNKEIFNDFMQGAKDKLNANLNRLVQERTRELEKALAAKTEFLNNISHEIRTPMQGVVNISDGLIQHWNEFDDQKKLELVTQVTKNAKRLYSLVGNLLDLSRMNAGKMLLEVQVADLNSVVLEIIEECQSLYANGKSIHFKFDPIKDGLLACDREKIYQVLCNLLTNAIKFSPEPSTITVKIEASHLTHEGCATIKALHLSVADQGVGIPEDELEAIFTPFIQSSKTKTKAGGTGLGLAICREIIVAHYGQIWAQNNEEVGATIHVVLPVNLLGPMKGDGFQSMANIPELEHGSPHVPPANVLMIDDEEASLISMDLVLHGTAYKLIKACGGIAGLEYLLTHQHAVDAILLDLMMPDMYGLDVLAKIKAHPNLSQIPVILQSGIADDAEIRKAYLMGVLAYISKPYDKRTVISALESCIKKPRSLIGAQSVVAYSIPT